MNASDIIAENLAEDYSMNDTDADQDWQTIPAHKRQAFALRYLRDHELELDFFASDRGVKALNAMLDLIVYDVTTGKPANSILQLLQDYQPAIDLFEKRREEYLLDTCINEQPDFDKILDART